MGREAGESDRESVDFDKEKAKFDAALLPSEKHEEESKLLDVKGQRLLLWLTDNGAFFPKLYLKQYEVEVRGVHTSGEINPNELVVSIPLQCLITVEMGKDTEIGRRILEADLDFVAPKHIFLMMYLLTDMQNRLNNMPIFWTESELRLLKGSYLLHQIAERKEAIRRDYEAICDIDADFGRTISQESRNFGITVRGIKTAALVPFADMLNHYRPRENTWTFNQGTECFTITSLCKISVGSQVYDSYGKKCNHRFLLNYGFAIEDNIEENGQNPNELMVKFDLSKIEKVASLRLKKDSFFHNSGDKNIQSRISMSYRDRNTKEVFSFARVLAANLEELREIFHYSDLAHNVPPISPENEIRALNIIADFMRDQRHAVIYMKGEKEIVQFYIQLAENMTKLLNMDWEQLQPLLETTYDDDDDASQYAQDIVAHLVSKRHKALMIARLNSASNPTNIEGLVDSFLRV